MTGWRIVCDAGGTTVRVARHDEMNALSRIDIMPTADCTNVSDMLMSYARGFADFDQLDGLAIAAAGPIDNGSVKLTNAPLSISASDVGRTFGGRPVRLLNDLEAVAWSLPGLKADEYDPIRIASDALRGPRLVVNLGTGFGAAVLVPVPSGWHSLACEPGHMRLAPCGDDGAAGARDWSIEQALSGMALASAAEAGSYWHSSSWLLQSGDHAGRFAAAHQSPQGLAFLQEFGRLLGQVSGDLVLATGAWGGVYLCGSVAQAWSTSPDKAAFVAAFEAKGPMSARMRRVSAYQVLAPFPGLRGLCAVPLGPSA